VNHEQKSLEKKRGAQRLFFISHRHNAMVLIKAAAVVAIIASANAFLQPAPMAIKSGEKLVTVFICEHGHVLMLVCLRDCMPQEH
jgi:hypothetical protein